MPIKLEFSASVGFIHKESVYLYFGSWVSGNIFQEFIYLFIFMECLASLISLLLIKIM